MRLCGIILAVFFLFPGCRHDKQDTTNMSSSLSDTAASILELHPSQATRETTFYITSRSFDLSNAAVRWFINDMPVEAASSREFNSPYFKKGDRVQARAIVYGKEICSNEVVVRNIRPAIVSGKLVPTSPGTNDILKAEIVCNDRDSDDVTLYYEWTKNGENAGSRQTLEGPFRRGDKISVKITPFDGEDYGSPVLLTADIHNSPPRFLTGSTTDFENGVYSYQIRATDPDEDTLTYSLRSSPSSMTIDSSTGLIRWNVPPHFVGRAHFFVCVTDGHGGETRQNFNLDIRSERAKYNRP